MDLMTAVAKGEPDTLVEWLQKKYPAPLVIKKKKKKVIPFKDTDRYLRGKIVDGLREEKKLSLQKVQKLLKVETDRFTKVIVQLEKDGLIKRVQKSIILQ